jgi:tetratricopeptide (TPR) repeat protein
MSPRQVDITPMTVGERYALEHQLGRGGMAVVHLARDLRLGRAVAVKWLLEERASTVSADRFLREIRIAGELEHPALVHILDAGVASGRPYYVMPYMPEGSLRALIDRERQLPLKRVVAIARDIADGLDCLHGHGIIHRDVKPENILFSGGRAHLADFGIARAVSEAVDERLTAGGLAVGTPAYMSPEQASGGVDLDSRTDVYSFGCVVYEMLAGVAPFVGPSPEAVIAQRFAHAPPELRRYRSVPEHMVRAVETALAATRADRFDSVREFVNALENPAFVPPVSSGATRRRRRTLVFVALGVAAAVALAFSVRPLTRMVETYRFPPLDTNRVAVVPLAARDQNDKPGVSAAQLADWLNDALGEWKDLPAVARLDVAQVIAKRGPARDLAAARQVGRALGAGRILSGDVESRGDSSLLRVGLYDVRSGRIVQERKTPIVRADVDLTGVVASMVRELLRDPRLAPSDIDRSDAATWVFPAFQAYGRARVALAAWDLSTAARELEAATKADPSFAPAQFWLAQVLSWMRDDHPELWGPPANRALLVRRGLSTRDSMLARGLRALAAARFPEACAEYGRLRARDSVDALAWYGIGECLARDPIVVRDRASPTGWSFRASYHGAVSGFSRALEIEPGLHVAFRYNRLRLLAITDPQRIRQGRAAQPDTTRFAAYPMLLGDTIAFVPQPISDFQAVRMEEIPPTWDLALARARDIHLEFVTSWTQRAPQSADAFEALADVLEQRGDVLAENGQPRSAMNALAMAKRFAADRAQQLRLGVREVRLATKVGDFARARTLADSLLAGNVATDSVSARALVGLAALTGRVELAARLQYIAGLEGIAGPISAPQPIEEVGSQFVAYTALGVCGDTLASLERTLDRLLGSYAEVRQRRALRQQVVELPLRFAVPCLGPKAARQITERNNPLVRMQIALANEGAARARAYLDTLDVARAAAIRPGDVTLDHAYQEAWLRAAIGDTSKAIARLDAILGALPTLSVQELSTIARAGGFVRAMALRAELAAARGDRRAARQWSAAVVTLWDGSDSLLHPIVARMQSIEAASR